MTESDRVQIKRLWDAGLPERQIVQMLPYNGTTARKMIAEMKSDGSLQKRHGIMRNNVIETYKRGVKSPYKIAEMYGLTYYTVTTYLSNAGLHRQREPRNYKKNDRTLEIIEMLKAGKSQAEIARQFGVSRQWVSVAKKRWQEGAYEK